MTEPKDALSIWIPLFTGFLAFVGVILGHFISFILTATTRRREVRRQQIERFAEFTSEDQAWMDTYRRTCLFGNGDTDSLGPEPSDKAFAIYALYFGNDISEVMLAFSTARHAYKNAIGEGLNTRFQQAVANNVHVSTVRLSAEDIGVISQRYGPYYQSLLHVLDGASKVAEQAVPESRIMRWVRDGWG